MTEEDQAALPEVQHRPRVEIPHTEQKLTSKTLQQIQTNKQQKNLLQLQMFRSFQSIYKVRVEKGDWLGSGVSV